MEGVKLDVGQLFGVLAGEIRQNALAAVIALAVLIIGNLAFDRLGQSASLAPAGFLALATQLYVTRSALMRAGLLADGSKASLWSFWGMSIVTSIAIVLGCVLLLIPGLYLAARWFVAGPAIIAEGASAGEGMRESWEITSRSVWHIAGALLLLYLCGFGAGMAPLFFYPENAAPLAVQAFSYLLVFGTSVCSWLMAVGAYRLMSQRGHLLAEVFA